MTLGIAWIREVGGIRELLISSDSRLSGGQHWDGNPKIFLLPRSDAVLSFAGETYDAYPLIQQAYNAIKMYPPAESRAMDLAVLKGHLVRVFDHSRTFISDLPRNQTQPDDPKAIFMLSGFSWKTKQFHIWKLLFDPSIGRFTFRPTSPWRGQEKESRKLVAYVGDEEAVTDAKERLVTILRDRNKLTKGALDMEPIEVLRDIIKSGKFASVGGPIQLVKIYEHANTVPVGVRWRIEGREAVCILGRPLLDYEKNPWGEIDPDNLASNH